MHLQFLIRCKPPYLYSMQSWGVNIVYKEQDPLFKSSLKILEFYKKGPQLKSQDLKLQRTELKPAPQECSK